ncbi:hypothetical protein KZI27_00295 (plasmid) [Curtobacterium sp. TC1]|uniref:hypothetical protein n=1 Tax=Curtobacterium sp. TC1 TaxID=2862880 RepID=UPI001C9B1889|nr:hypothetical protein [Curtobacterium sp. TC1]QZQ53715.1 hypothetical protein KZI27_00295 [Curtobacterium sp. TC1]
MSEFVRTSPGRNPDNRDAHGVDLVVDDTRPATRLLIRGALPHTLEQGGRVWATTAEAHDGAGGPPIAVYRPQT